MIKSLLTLLSLSLSASLTDPGSWQHLSFGKVTPNEVTFSDATIEIDVNHSASPLLHLFSHRSSVRTLRVTGTVTGDWKFALGSDWSNSPDDALLRIGLIENGSRRLNALERIAAPDWIKKVESLSQSTADGIGTIRCFHLMPDDQWIGKSRENPNASVFQETVVATPQEDGSFELLVELDTPIDTVGLWLLCDGDDSNASFTVKIDKIEVGVAP